MIQQPTQLDRDEAQALYALMNLEQAVQAADWRVQQATDQTFRRMQYALNQSETNNRILLKRIEQLTQEITLLKQQNKELADQVATQGKAKETYIKAEKGRMRAVIINVDEGCRPIKKYKEERAKIKFDPRCQLSFDRLSHEK